MLSLPVVTCLTRGDKKKFWDAYVKGNHELFCEVLDTLRFRIHENITDPRGRELLLDAIVWALKYPAIVLRPKPTKGQDIYSLDSPNIAAFISLLDGLHDLMKPSGAKIVKFHHDVQSQFGNAIAETFKVLHRVTIPQNLLLVEKVKTFGCRIEFLPSQASIGVQLIDVCLWLMVKSFKGAVLPESYNLRSLLGCILGRGLIKENSLEQLKSDCEADNHRMMSMEISDKQLADGKQFTQQQEARRIRRMNSPPEA